MIKTSCSWPLGRPSRAQGAMSSAWKISSVEMRSTWGSGTPQEGTPPKPHMPPPGLCMARPVVAKWKRQETLDPVYLPLNDRRWVGQFRGREHLTFPLGSGPPILDYPDAVPASTSGQNRSPSPACSPTGVPPQETAFPFSQLPSPSSGSHLPLSPLLSTAHL